MKRKDIDPATAEVKVGLYINHKVSTQVFIGMKAFFLYSVKLLPMVLICQ